MSYRSYKASSSSYRYSGSTEGSSSSRLRTSTDDDFSTSPSSYSSRRISSYNEGTSLGDDYGISSSTTSRRSFQASSRLTATSRYSTDNDLDLDSGTTTTRYSSSKYKISNIDDDDDDLGSLSSTRKYSRYGSRDENDNFGVTTSTTTRLSRYSTSLDAGDDDTLGGISSSSVVRRRTSRLSYLNEEDDDINRLPPISPTSPRSYRPSLSSSYEVTTPVDDDSYKASFGYTESSEKRRYQTGGTGSGTMKNRSLSRTDSRDASNQIYEVILDYKPPRSAIDEISLKEGQEVIVLSKDKPHKWKVRTRKSKNFTMIEEGFAPSAYLKPTNEKVDDSELMQASLASSATGDTTPTITERSKNDGLKDLNKKKEMIVRELIETEEDLIRDMQFVQRTYIRQSDSSITPKEIKAVKDQIFGCFKELLEFHKDVLLKNFQNLAKEPTKIGTMFLKMQSDFVNHSKYCQNLSKALEILEENSDVNEYFNNYSMKIRDEKQLSEHLKLPLQRLNDYQLLLKELSKNLQRLDEDVGDLEKAVKFIASVPDNEVEDEGTKKPDLSALTSFNFNTSDFNLPGGSTEKLSNLLKNVLQAKDFFDVIESDGSKKERFIFFFKSRMFITEINKNISADQRTYNVERIIKLPEVDISAEDSKTLLIKSKDASNPQFPIRLKCDDEQRIKTWLDIIQNLSKLPDDSEEVPVPKLLSSQLLEEKPKVLDENNNKIQQQKSKPANDDVQMSNQDDKKQEDRCYLADKPEKDKRPVEEEPIQAKKVKTLNSEETSSTPKSNDDYRIITDLKSITKPVGESAIFQCQVAPGTVNIQWLKDNGILSGSNYKTYKKDDSYFLELRDLSVDHSGIYTFIASNAQKSVASSSSLNVLSDDSRPTSPGGSFLPHPPKFKVKLKDTELLEGATVRFELIVRGLPIPTINIYKDDKPLKEDDHLKIRFQSKEVFEIIIEHVRQTDAGVYKCIAVNPEGEAETSGKITVSKNKDVFFGLDENSIQMIKSDPTSPRCMSPSFKWFKDGKEFEASERFQVQYDDQEDTVALIFQHVTPNDAGLYTCVAATSSGKISCNAELNVQGVVTTLPKTPVAPKFLKDLSNVEVIKGQSVAMLEAQISGCPKPIITWFKDDKKLEANDHFKMLTEGEENVTLVIKNVAEEDAGKYKLQASNKLGVVESEAELKIVKKPELTQAPDKIEVAANDQLIIEQTYEAVPEPKIEWQKDGKALKQSDRIKTVIEPETHKIKLIIDKATSEDAGNYVCLLSNNLGTAKAKTDVVVKSVPKFLKRIEAIEVVERETAIFTGQYSVEGGNAKIEFYKESKLLKASERIQIKEDKEGNFSLIIKDCNADDEGKYRFVIKNDYGYEEDEASLVVKKRSAAPEFKDQLKNLEAMLNDENVQLSVKIDGEPKPEIKWFHDGKQISATDDKFKIVEKDNCSTLIIPKVLHEHQGSYVCKSENPNGQAETCSELIVKCPPYVVKHLENAQSDLGQEVKLTAVIKGNPKPEIKWFCNETEIKISDDRKKYSYDEASASYTLCIKKLQEEDIGKYKIEAQNSYGKCSSTCDVQFVSKPVVIKHLENVQTDFGQEVKLTAVIKGNPKPEIKWFCNETEIKIGDDRRKYSYDEASASYTLCIKKLQETDLGVYRIEAQNSYGKCSSTSEIQLATKPLFSKVLKNVAAKEMQSNIELVVQLDKKSAEKPTIKWFKDDQEIKDNDKNYKKIEDKLDNSYKLVILKATEEMIGKYKCVASNDFGSAETAARFDIITKPKFIKGLHDVDVEEGNNVSMTVQLSGFPQPDVQFYKDGEEISTEAKVQIKKVMDDIYEFQIENIRIIMSGEYECRIKNEAGEASSKGVIQVCSRPQFLKDLQEQMNVSVGDDVLLEVVVNGQPSPQIKWFRNGQETAGSERLLLDQRAESYCLKIPNAVENDSGTYQCIASNKFGETESKKSQVQVTKSESSPIFTKRLEDTEVVVDDNVQFRTAVQANPPAEVFWSKDSVPLESGPKVQIKSEGDEHILIMKNVQQSDSGLIGCKAQNAKGFTTQTAYLSVEEPTLPTIIGLNDTKVVDGEPCKIEATITGFPKPIVQWFKINSNDKDNDNDDNNRIPVNSEAIFSELKTDKYGLNFEQMCTDLAGPYKCVASNCAGTVEKSFQVDICGKKPIFVKELEETEIVMSMDRKNNRLQLGQSAIFETIVDGVPTPEVKWLKNDKQLVQNDRVLISNVDNEHKLEIKTLTKDDVAKYTCKATNKYGEAQTITLLKFLNEPHEPVVTKPLEDVQIEQGDELKLYCKVDGEPMPAVRWLKDQQPLEGSERAQITSKKDGSTTLVIEKTELADSGIYQVDAENAKGVTSSTAKVLVVEPQRPPSFPAPLPDQIKVDCNKCLVLQAEVFGLPPPKIEWLKDGKPLKQDARTKILTQFDDNGNGKCKLEIANVKKDDAGSYTLKATNDNGQLLSKSKVQVMPEPYSPLVVENLPVTVQVAVGEPIEICSKIDAHPQAKITWEKEKTPLSPLNDDRISIKNDQDGSTCLTIQSAKPEDQGVYILKAENSVGETSTSTKVQIISPELGKEPEMIQKDKSKTLTGEKPPTESESDSLAKKLDDKMKIEKSIPNEIKLSNGETLELQMKLSSKPIAIDDIKIFKDDKLVAQGSDNLLKDNLQINDDGLIKFKQENCSPNDSGLYRIEIQTEPNQQLSSSCQVNVLEKAKAPEEKKLRFNRQLESVEIESGSPCRLECSIDLNDSTSINFNELNVQWFKDGEELLPNEHYGFVKEPNSGVIALLVDSFAAKDVGSYTVKISNKNEEITSTGKATMKPSDKAIKSKPQLLDELKDVSGDDKSSLCLKCQVNPDSGPFTCKWLCNGKELKESDNVKFLNFPDGTIMLQINGAGPDDSGKYSVKIANKAGETISEVDVKVPTKKEDKKPKMLKGLEPKTLIAGQPGSLEIQMATDSDDGGGDISFLHNGKLLMPDDRIHIQKLPDGIIKLNFDLVNLDDAGTYTAIFKNDSGSEESTALVTVKSQPIIVKPLEDTIVKEKCSTKFEVQIDANPEPEIVWTKNGSKIQVDGKHFTTAKTGDNCYCLIINDCVLRDKGDYQVKATNELGTAQSKAKLEIVSGKEFEECSPIFLENLHDITAGNGDTVILKAKIKAHPVPKIVWKKDNQEIQMNPEKIFSNFNGEDLELTILNFGQNDSGVYEVYVSNDLGQTSSSAKVTEQEGFKPRFVKKLKDLETNFKSPTKLTCKVEAYPEAKISWLYNGKPIESGLKYSFVQEFGEQVLNIFDPKESDSGVYECVAENRLGSDKTVSNVLFIEKDKEPVQFIEKLQDYDVLPGATARLVACVVGNPKPEFKWFKDDKEIKFDNNDKYAFTFNENGIITFEIKNVTEQDLGKYRCHAFNQYGSDDSICQLNFETVDGLDRMNQLHKSKKSQQRVKDAADDLDYQTGGLPQKLTEKPIITKMIDNSLTLLWLPSIPEQPRFPVSYVVEFCKISDGTWTVYHDGIKDIKCDVVGLEPYEDYGFRVRVANKFGISDPSPSVTAFRSQLKDRDHEAHLLKMAKPDDFEIPHKPPEKVAAAPEFVREENSFMYGVVGQPTTIEFWIYGYPEPEISWFFEEQKLENQGQFKFLKDRNGRTCLIIDKITDQNFGYFTCVAKNEHGEQKKTIKLVRADPPKFTKTLEETTVLTQNHIRLQCSAIGSPEPVLKWYKDYQPLHDTSRMKVVRDSSETTTITISDAMARDSGLYSCTATNVAGSTTTSAFIHVKDQEISFDRYSSSSYREAIKPKNKKFEQFYDIGDELGRGTQGVTYHAVERTTGNSYAAKMMHGTGEMRQYMMQELEIMNQLGSHEHIAKLHDCLASTPYSISLVMGLCGGGTLLDYILKKGSITEQEVADYVRQILEGLHYMHYKNIGHFGLTIGDILLQRINGNDLTIVDFGLASRIAPGASHYVEFGQPEFVSPEIVNKNSVTLTTDVWSAGIITYILLTGVSPFFGENDKATLQNIQNKKLDLSDEKLGHISEKGRDFLKKTLNFDQNSRLDVNGALNHPWITGASQMETNQLNIMDNLRDYKSSSDKWYKNASCKRYYRRRTLHSCYTHPSRMIYPPDEQYSPLISPEREMKKFQRTVAPFENIYPRNQTFGSENFSSDSHYQCGPDTYLLQLRDTDFPARIRRYLRIAAVNSPLIASNLQQAHWGRSNWEHTKGALTGTFSQVSIKERRKFTDIMDEEINDEMKGHFYGKPRRLAREVGTPLYLHKQLKTLKRETKISQQEILDQTDCLQPFFREKLRDQSFKPGDNVRLQCYAVGIPQPTYTWFRNDTIIIETNRTKVKRLDDGRCQLLLEPSKDYDIGVYKCVARNTLGSVVCRARLVIGDVPSNILPPVVKDYSAHDALLIWTTPKHTGDAYVKCYRLEFKKVDDAQWQMIGEDIKQEFFLLSQVLEPNQSYHFRVTAQNRFGWSEPSLPSDTIKTLTEEENKTIALPPALQIVVCQEQTLQENENDQEQSQQQQFNSDYFQIEKVPIPLIKSEYKELYDFKSIIAQGKFSVITKAYIKDGTRKTLACKCVLTQSEQESSINNEYEISKSLAHEKIARLWYANRDSNLFTLITELQCGLNILTYLNRMQFYSEQLVSTVICQVLDAIEYLHFRNICLLELQPDNILMVDERSQQIKLTDFANARFITNNNGNKVTIVANPEYIAPELIRNDEVSIPYTDIWTVGVLTYILLSGHSPFKGSDQKETAQNVVFVRYLFERLYPKVTQEAIRFLLAVFKLTTHKRPTIEECLESKWLLPNEFMIKKREAAIFETTQINNFTKEFFEEKIATHSRLYDLIGLKE